MKIPNYPILVLFPCLMLALNPLMGVYPGADLENLYRLDRLPYLRPGIRCKMFSSYDRTGGNNDGFNGTYSKTREENGNSVIAEMEGPGCIRRIWFTHSLSNKDGLLNRNAEHIMIYLDGSETPALDEPLEKLFSGELPQFPKPLVGSGLGGFYCYVPIPYRNGCKVAIQGTGVRFYQLTYNEFQDDNDVETFSMLMTPERKIFLEKAVRIWSSPGDLGVFELPGSVTHTFDLDMQDSKPIALELPTGPRMIRGIYLDVDESNKESAMESSVSFQWEKMATPAATLPLEYFFGQAFDPEPFRSLLFGECGEGYYNFIPMPYIYAAEIKIAPKRPWKGTLRIVTTPFGDSFGGWGYFHANYAEQVPTEDGLSFVPLNISGKGHYIGIYVAMEGQKGEPGWLEGDEKITIDGELAIHGTGTEDFFNCGWYAINNRLTKPGYFPQHGFPVYGQTESAMRTATYRWHIADPVPYSKEIVFKLEHGPQNDRTADYRSAAFFYDVNPAGIKSRDILPRGEECIAYLNQRVWQLASQDPDQGSVMIVKLHAVSERKENKILIEGLYHYFDGLRNPGEYALLKLGEKQDEMNRYIETMQEGQLFEKPEIKLPTDNDNLIPKSLVTARMILERATLDLARKTVLKRGFQPGDELVIEARDPFGVATREPFYKETEDFANSYAKVDDVHLLGKGARFTYGNKPSSRARFTPEIPQKGFYEVFTIFSYGANAGDTRYRINHADGATTIALEQRGRPGTQDRNNKTWHSLGTFRFEKGLDPERGSVTLHPTPGLLKPNNDFEYRAYSDAVRFVFRGEKIE